MRVLCPGKAAKHVGRYFYKCPGNVNHPGSFMWCEDYHNSNPTVQLPSFVLDQEYHPKKYHGRCETDKSGCFPSVHVSSVPKRHYDANKVFHIILVFMGIVLFLLGVIVGKLL